MYQIQCDGLVLYDPRDDDYVVASPKCKMEVNTVGEASFTVYSIHPNYDKLQKMKSVIEILQDGEAIFRGRITDDTKDFDNKKVVDIEGAMAYFNDSVIRPFNFPEDFLTNPEYTAAETDGNVVEFFLKWVIDQHNSQVQSFQRFILGNVSVSDPNNYITRSSESYLKSWEVLKEKLFDSSLGGFLCIRYESDGNYIDYIEDFDQTNSQDIVFGENLLDLTNESDASSTYSAVIPLGAKKNEIDKTSSDESRLTISDNPDGYVTDDIVKSGDTLYSVSAVEKYGWIYAPVDSTTYEDVTTKEQLQSNGVKYLSEQAVKLSNTITIKAVDLHFSDNEIERFRMYRYINVYSKQHNQYGSYRLSKLEIDILNPQNTIITIGDTVLTLTDVNASNKKSLSESVESIKSQATNQNEKISEAYNKSESTAQKVETFEGLISGLLDYFSIGENKLILGESGSTDLFEVFLKVLFENVVQFLNNNPIFGTTPSGAQTEAFNPCDLNGNTVVGNGSYNNQSGELILRGNDVKIGVSNLETPTLYKPYFGKGDSLEFSLFRTCGLISAAGKQLFFIVPLEKPIIGSPTITVDSINGFVLRQNGNYTHGSAASTWVKPTSYTVTQWEGSCLQIRADFTNVTNAVNNDSIGVQWSGKITFS